MVLGPINTSSPAPVQPDTRQTEPAASTSAAPQVSSEQNQRVPSEISAQAADVAASRQEQQQQLEEVVSNINDFVQSIQRNLQFSVSEDGSRTIITVINPETEEVIRQIPPEEVLAISAALRDQIKEGVLLNEQV